MRSQKPQYLQKLIKLLPKDSKMLHLNETLDFIWFYLLQMRKQSKRLSDLFQAIWLDSGRFKFRQRSSLLVLSQRVCILQHGHGLVLWSGVSLHHFGNWFQKDQLISPPPWKTQIVLCDYLSEQGLLISSRLKVSFFPFQATSPSAKMFLQSQCPWGPRLIHESWEVAVTLACPAWNTLHPTHKPDQRPCCQPQGVS